MLAHSLGFIPGRAAFSVFKKEASARHLCPAECAGRGRNDGVALLFGKGPHQPLVLHVALREEARKLALLRPVTSRAGFSFAYRA